MKSKFVLVGLVLCLLLVGFYFFNDGEKQATQIDEFDFTKNLPQEEILQIAEIELSAELKERSLNLAWNMTEEEISFLDGNWQVKIIANYDFGCCSSCGVGSEICISVCAPCGRKTIENNLIINLDGEIL